MSALSLKSLQLTKTGISGELSGGFSLVIDIVEPRLMRVAVIPKPGLEIDRTWMIAPNGDCPIEGRDRLSTDGFSLPNVEFNDNCLESETLRVGIQRDPFALSIEVRKEGAWQKVVQDDQERAYQWLERRGTFQHFQNRGLSDQHFGLGDKAGTMDRTHQRFRCLQTDALGYNAEKSDPLYKHAPFFIVQPEEGAVAGILYDTFAEIDFDFGSEHSNYFKPFRHVSAKERALVYWVIAGDRIRDIVPALMKLTGLPAMPPRWSMGFAFSAMAHTDAPEAPKVIKGFASQCRNQKIPISAIHFGSGYSMHADGKRYVFDWNKGRYPDPEGLLDWLSREGFKTCANVKPVLLTEHNHHKKAAEEGWFVSRADGSPALEKFWDGKGAQLDFTNPKAINWWQQNIKFEILGRGFNGVWNDNNEAELWDETATINGFGNSLSAMEMRPVHALLMTRASHDAAVEANPGERPYTISRAGPLGIARYGETWTGDNETAWHTLRWNLNQGLSMSVSGFPMVGHDIGGFSGPVPSPELLVRWFQMMALHPRAVMNSWKPEIPDGTNTPFMYQEMTDHIREVLRLRYRFLPYLYSLAHKMSQTGEPVIRPLFYDHDEMLGHEEQVAFMLGEDVLVAPVVEPGSDQVHIHLPKSEFGWIDFHTHLQHEGGKSVALDAPLDRLPLLIKGGAVLPLAADWTETAPHDAAEFEVMVFPTGELGDGKLTWFHDDGFSPIDGKSSDCLREISMQWCDGKVEVAIVNQPELTTNITCANDSFELIKKTD